MGTETNLVMLLAWESQYTSIKSHVDAFHRRGSKQKTRCDSIIGSGEDIVAQIQKICGSNGVDYSVDSARSPSC